MACARGIAGWLWVPTNCRHRTARRLSARTHGTVGWALFCRQKHCDSEAGSPSTQTPRSSRRQTINVAQALNSGTSFILACNRLGRFFGRAGSCARRYPAIRRRAWAGMIKSLAPSYANPFILDDAAVLA